tara:strand:+ start:880 stop:1680 length:801 start_codon:yes stop_codon:yes gene_type:complete
MSKYIGWFSCGVTSAIACKLALDTYGKENVDLYYIKIDSAHPDNDRFIADCEEWFDVKIKTIQSKKYSDQFDVIEQIRYVNGVNGAPCTLQLKKKVRFDLQKALDYPIQVFGFEFETKQVNRAIRFIEQFPETKPIFPLIEGSYTKEICAGLIIEQGIELPTMYKLGYNNNNCIGCVKGGRGYWAKIKIDFPETFQRMAELEREVGATCIKNVYLDELKEGAGRKPKAITPDCGSFCQIKYGDIKHKQLDLIMSNPQSIRQLYFNF